MLVELALVSVLLLTIAAGTYDYGMAWRAGLAGTEAARTGARVGSAQADAVGADFALLSGTRSALASSGQLSNVTRVVIYQSSTTTGEVPANCKTTTSSSISEKCNILTGAQFRAMPTAVGTGTLDSKGCIAASQTRNWCPTDRNGVQLTADYLGVWVQLNYSYQFRLVGTTRSIERDAVMRLEP
ncbi:pilus assembly protein [Aquihabitans sp. G128]|uniref:TadE/TadG family type IV pilus assembly protein n=1 Tax=Aquihabitans sp. G128 TaxID=2849779 RepID=UPI001C236684|nr:TadE family protein [Aquihabitans sp. G128]QXC62714.1 pilus assembly protein [Aquihabitans sp. G128]